MASFADSATELLVNFWNIMTQINRYRMIKIYPAIRCDHRKNLGCCVALILPSRMRISVTATMPIMSKPNANREVVVGLMILMLEII